MLRMDEGFASRYVNDGFSGGEKKRLEMLQMAVLEPEMAILDETDSGLDIDALRIVAEGVNAMLNPKLGVLLITHYQRLLNYITPDVRARPGPGPDRRERRQGPGAQARGRGLRTRSCARPASDRRAGRGAARAAAPRPATRSKPVESAARRACDVDDDHLGPPVRALDPDVLRARLPILRAGDQRPRLVYLDSASDKPEAQRESSMPVPTITRVRRQRPPRDLHDRREGDRGIRGGARARPGS